MDWSGPRGGKGLRLGLPYPKELYPIIRDNRYKPVSQFVIDNLVTAGVRHTVFVINETKSQLLGYFGSGQRFGCDISYVVQEQARDDALQSTSPGLAHALDAAFHLTCEKTVFFGMADTIMQPNEIFALGRAAMQAEDEVLLCLFPTLSPQKFGMVRLDSDRRVVEVVDKPAKTDLKEMWGCMIWRTSFTAFLHRAVQDGQGDFARIMNDAIAAGLRFSGLVVPESNFIDLGTYEEIMELDKRLRED